VLGFLIIVYGENFLSRRESLWKDLQHISGYVQGHLWLMAGDFNTARYTNEKVGGRTLNIGQLVPFNDCVTHCNLSDMRSKGSSWSWNNKNTAGSRIVVRLDRCLCNDGWLNLFPVSYYEYLPWSTSDHSPMLVHMLCNSNSGPKPFKFFNYWLQCAGFLEVLASA